VTLIQDATPTLTSSIYVEEISNKRRKINYMFDIYGMTIEVTLDLKELYCLLTGSEQLYLDDALNTKGV